MNISSIIALYIISNDDDKDEDILFLLKVSAIYDETEGQQFMLKTIMFQEYLHYPPAIQYLTGKISTKKRG